MTAIFCLVAIKQDDYLFGSKRLQDKKKILKGVGVVDNNGNMVWNSRQIDILSHFANHTYIIESKELKCKKILKDLKMLVKIL